jgi:hypothetical protein
MGLVEEDEEGEHCGGEGRGWVVKIIRCSWFSDKPNTSRPQIPNHELL